MKKLYIYFLLLSLIGRVHPIQAQLISNQERIQDIAHMLSLQQKLTSKGETSIWKYLKKDLPSDEKQALQFLYAYMPLSDMADYSPVFMHMNVRYALRARSEMPWGKIIPEDIFLHFVLPLRVNNENLDSFREVMYEELKSRIQGLSMEKAALEVNHWCHEKVSYRGTDIRTSAPLSTVKKTFGRCGEESTFTVTALRTIGIPARQVYTPRWAHSDDNHAWVEVWIDGKWQFLGACEPDPRLNMGWFAEPATRAMLVHTRAYGKYMGNEEIVTESSRFSELNLTSHYAPVKKVKIQVSDDKGILLDGAKVEFGLYNYAEFYPIATRFTNKGITDLSLGLGDLLVWASYKGKFGYAKLSVSSTDTLRITVDKKSLNNITNTDHMVPPKVGKVTVNATAEEIRVNSLRLLQEDSIRHNYIATFKDSVWASALADRLKLDKTAVKQFIAKSYGNWDNIAEFLEKGALINPKYTIAFLRQVSDKDLSDGRADIFLSQLNSAMQNLKAYTPYNDSIFTDYVLATRIANENLSPWRVYLFDAFGNRFVADVRKDIAVLRNWIARNITIDNDANMHSRTPLSPEGVYNLRVADKQSRDIFFVATCRSFGIASRINQATQQPQYFENGQWRNITFGVKEEKQPVKGKLHLVNGDNLIEPQYYLHFTIAKLIDGSYKTLEFDESKRISEFADLLPLDTGYYSLVTGNRQSDGSVLSSISYFKVSPDSVTNVKVELVRESSSLTASGKLDLAKLQIQDMESHARTSLSDLSKDKQSVLVIIDPDKEPSKHILNDLAPYNEAFAKSGAQFIFISSQQKSVGMKILNTYPLPKNYVAGTDISDKILDAVAAEYGQTTKDKLPLVLFYSPTGQIYYFSSGYRIGVGEQLLRVLIQAQRECSLNNVKSSCTKN
ncbi:MAG: transglutaminase-like domain-containing protein [Dysgonamonadaceae bacterium]